MKVVLVEKMDGALQNNLCMKKKKNLKLFNS